jgi:hypothetical protein
MAEIVGGFVFQQHEFDHFAIMFQGTKAVPAGYEVGLFASAPNPSDAPVDLIGEVTGAGYSRPQLGRNNVDWPTNVLDTDSHYKCLSKAVNFTATGDWTEANYWVVFTTDTPQRVVNTGPLDATLLLKAGQTKPVIVGMK